MGEGTRNDLKIAGSTTVAGGIFNRVTIAGQAEINGNLDCIDFKVTGSSEVKGNLKAETLKVSGSAAIEGNLQSDEVKISGSFTSRGGLSVKKINISGSADIAGDISAEEVQVSGSLATKSDCEAESFVAMGSVTIGGMLNAGNIDIKHYGSSRAKEIGGEHIIVRTHVTLGLHKIIKLFHPPSKFTAETIEGDDIHLEYTRAKVVRGNNVHIGPGCEVDLVEYKDTFQQDREATVKEQKRMSPE